MTAKIGALFAGYGGLDMAVMRVIDAELAWVSENEAAPSSILAHHYPHLPNHGDITRISWSDVTPVDVLTAGYPCQPFSNAGQRKGVEDARNLWPQVERTIRDLRPGLVVLENVAAHINRGFGDVLGSLAGLGFDAEWACLRAADVGAPHGRNRLFVVAWPVPHADGTARGERWVAASGQAESGRARPDTGRRGGVPAAHADRIGPGNVGRVEPSERDADGCHRTERTAADTTGDGRHERRAEPTQLERGHDAPERGAAPAHADRDGLESVRRVGGIGCDADGRDNARQEVAWGPYGPAVERWERVTGRAAPAPTEHGRTGNPRLSPRFVEWLMGLPDGWVTSVPDVTRNEQLRMLGNGVVPQQAAAAIRRLLDVREVAA